MGTGYSPRSAVRPSGPKEEPGGGIGKVGPIEDVEGLDAKLQTGPLTQAGLLDKGKIELS